MIEKIKNIIRYLAIIIISLLLVITILQRILPQDSKILKLKTYVIVSKSMEPKLSIGDVILVYKIDPNSIKIGDIVTYQGLAGELKNKIITHQVINVTNDNNKIILKTQGMNNVSTDSYPVYENQIYGKMIYKFILLSFFSKILRNKIAIVIAVVIPLLILFGTEIKELIKELKKG